jgi:lysine-N-methylase
MTLPALAPRYMSRFRCITERCEATCCAGLLVPISEAEWARVQRLVARDTGVAPQAASHRDAATGTESLFMPERGDGHCTFLADDKLCSLHRRHGDAVLPDICVTFPRVTVRWDAHLEMAGTLSCPEVARLALLAEDALEVEPIEQERVFRPEAAASASTGDAEKAWGFHAPRVRATALRLLRRGDVPLPERLHALHQLASRLHPFYFQNTEAFRGEGRAAAEARLTEVLQAADSAEALAAAHQALAPQPVPGAFLARLYLSTATALLNYPVARCRGLLRGVLDSYGGAEAEPEAVWRLYEERRERLERAHGARVRQYFHHHAINHWLVGPFLYAQNVLVDAFHLALSGALLRWALLGHPEVVRLCEGEADLTEAAARERLDAAAVETFQILTRHVLRAPVFMAYSVTFAGQDEEQSQELMRAVLLGYRDAPVQAA